jgi:N-acetylneuraminic acid mutarotase
MLCTYRTLLDIIALNVASIGQTDEPAAIGSSRKADAFSSTSIPAWPTLKWKTAAPSPFARVESPTAVVNGKIYLFGGFTEELQASNQVDVYDPARDSWTRKRDMPTRLTHLNPTIDGNTIWFAGGFRGKHPGSVTDEVWKYDIASDTWTSGPPLPERRAGGGLAVVEHTLHYFGGY